MSIMVLIRVCIIDLIDNLMKGELFIGYIIFILFGRLLWSFFMWVLMVLMVLSVLVLDVKLIVIFDVGLWL